MIFHGIGQPKAFPAHQRHARRGAVKLHHIADAAQPQGRRGDPQSPQDQQVAPCFAFRAVMGGLVKDLPLRRAGIFRPLPLHEDQSPLAAAVGEMLQGGKGGFRFPFFRNHPIC